MEASNTGQQANQTSVAAQRHQLQLAGLGSDQAVDMFTERGFVLANRIAKAFASSSAVPAQFQQFNLKKAGGEEQWVENPSAIGNCLVAIEVARAVGMSIVAVMQNADMIEGKLRWSGKFVIAAINASKRFTPLRFDMKDLGPIKATYKEKTGWDKQERRPIFAERTVDVQNQRCIAWALPYGVPFPPGVYTLEQAKAAGLPVIESAPVTMRMAVEEGWYGKAGSKWQTELRELMFQYRAGSFFGNVHAPDIVMGMGRTAEEVIDMMPTLDVDNDGRVTGFSVDEVRRTPGEQPEPAEVVPPGAGSTEAAGGAGAPAAGATGQQQDEQAALPPEEVEQALDKVTTELELQAARALIPRVQDAMDQARLNAKATARQAALTGGGGAGSSSGPRSRRSASPASPE